MHEDCYIPAWQKSKIVDDTLNFATSVDIDLNGSKYNKILKQKLKIISGYKHAVVLKSCTQALTLTLYTLGITRGCHVAVPAWGFVAVCSAITLVGAEPVFVDVDPYTWTMDINDFNYLYTKNKIDAIILIDLFGVPCNTKEFAKFNVPIIVDAAHSFGGDVSSNWENATAVCTSFYPTKPLGGLTEGGAVFTNDDHINDKLCSFIRHGDYGNVQGTNGRLGELEALILTKMFDNVDERIAVNKKTAAVIQNLFKTTFNEHVTLQQVPKHVDPVWYQVAVVLESKSAHKVISDCVEQSKMYTTTLNVLPAWHAFFRTCPVAEQLARTTVCVPVYDNLDTLLLFNIFRKAKNAQSVEQEAIV